MIAIDIANLKKTYANGTVALRGVNLQIEEGDFCALLGANGAGKTTIIGILTSIVNKTSGKVKVFDYDIDTQHSEAKFLMGVVPQEMNFGMFEKVIDIVVNQAGFFGIDRLTAQGKAEVLLKKLGLWEKRDQPSRNLSGGMKRRLMIARGLINNPKILILDEPTAGVDVELRYGMWEFLREMNANGTTILLTTHYLEEVEQMCKNAFIIKQGEIVSNGRVKDLVRLVDKETYIVSVDKMMSLDKLKAFNAKAIDEHNFELELDKNVALNHAIFLIGQTGMQVSDFRPKGNRMEKLFLKILQH